MLLARHPEFGMNLSKISNPVGTHRPRLLAQPTALPEPQPHAVSLAPGTVAGRCVELVECVTKYLGPPYFLGTGHSCDQVEEIPPLIEPVRPSRATVYE